MKLNREQKQTLRRETEQAMKDKLREQYKNVLDYQIKKSREELIYYVELVNHNWKKTRFCSYILPKVQDFLEDKNEFKGVQILIISVPPQSGKSLSVTETVPSWYIGKYPEKRCILVSYGDDLARRFGRRNKQKIEEWGDIVFDVHLNRNKKSDIDFELDNKYGGIIARGIQGGISGNPAELILIDDPIRNREMADSPTQRDKIWDEFQNSIYTRLQANGKIILIQTRWHEDDLAGRIIKSKAYEHAVINLPCEAEENDPLGRKPGEPLVPELGKGKKWLAKTKKAYLEGTNEDVGEFGSGQRVWYALYQGRPTIEGGNIINENWWKYYEVLPRYFDIQIMSVDASFKDNEDSDFVSIQVWGKYGMQIYMLDRYKKRMGFPETIEQIRRMKQKHPRVQMILIEDKANGTAIIQTLKTEMYGIVPVTPTESKIARVHAITHSIETGWVYLPKNAPWLYDFIQECTQFPNGSHDDDVDSMSQALARLTRMKAVYHPEQEVKTGYYSPDELEEKKQEKIDSGEFHEIKRPGRKLNNRKIRRRYMA